MNIPERCRPGKEMEWGTMGGWKNKVKSNKRDVLDGSVVLTAMD